LTTLRIDNFLKVVNSIKSINKINKMTRFFFINFLVINVFFVLSCASLNRSTTCAKKVNASEITQNTPQIESKTPEIAQVSTSPIVIIEKDTPQETPQEQLVEVEKIVVIEEKKEVIVEEKKQEVETLKVETNQPLNQSTNQPLNQSTTEPINQSTTTTFNDLLQKHVSATGKVNYKELKTNKTQLEEVIKTFQDSPPQESWSKNEKLAYWMNVYNVFTLKLIVDNYPISSIMKLDNGKPWDVKRIEIDGKKYSLNDIENVILRPKFKDARIHFGINCAAKSCPPLHNEAFTAENVQTLLTQRTRKFIRSSANNLSENSAEISKIFEWYAADFGDIVAFLNKYATVKISPSAKVTYSEYSWDLNSN
jgi:hypothetical protein